MKGPNETATAIAKDAPPGRVRRDKRGPLFGLLVLVTLSGCQTTVTAPQRPGVSVSGGGSVPDNRMPAPPPEPFHGDLIGDDPCAGRLQDICGQLLLYYARNGKLPSRLDELASVPDLDGAPDYNCPVTHLMYAYAPRGLWIAGDPHELIVYDAVPHGGKRHVILFIPTAHGRQPPTADAVTMPEKVFEAYKPSRPAPRPPASLPANR